MDRPGMARQGGAGLILCFLPRFVIASESRFMNIFEGSLAKSAPELLLAFEAVQRLQDSFRLVSYRPFLTTEPMPLPWDEDSALDSLPYQPVRDHHRLISVRPAAAQWRSLLVRVRCHFPHHIVVAALILVFGQNLLKIGVIHLVALHIGAVVLDAFDRAADFHVNLIAYARSRAVRFERVQPNRDFRVRL